MPQGSVRLLQSLVRMPQRLVRLPQSLVRMPQSLVRVVQSLVRMLQSLVTMPQSLVNMVTVPNSNHTCRQLVVELNSSVKSREIPIDFALELSSTKPCRLKAPALPIDKALWNLVRARNQEEFLLISRSN